MTQIQIASPNISAPATVNCLHRAGILSAKRLGTISNADQTKGEVQTKGQQDAGLDSLALRCFHWFVQNASGPTLCLVQGLSQSFSGLVG